MHYRDGYLIVSAPEFVQRQIFGYPKVPPPEGVTAPPSRESEAAETPQPR